MERREGMEGGGVESRNGAMKTPTHTFLHAHTHTRHKGKRLRGKHIKEAER